MKKLLALVLALVFALGLAVPALALEDMDPPLWARWGYASLEEFLADFELTEEDYADMVADSLQWRAEISELYESYDPERQDFDPPLWQYLGYDSLQAMLDEYGIDPEDYSDIVDIYLFDYETMDWTDEEWDVYYNQMELESVELEREALGLNRDLNVMINGRVLEFSDALPEIVNGRVMLPLRAVMEGIGAEVEYFEQTRSVAVTKGDIRLILRVDDDSCSILRNGVETEKVLDSVPYLRNNRVFVPLRFVGDALGYSVSWSDRYRTAVLIDPEAAATEIDREYTVLNAALAMGKDLSRDTTWSQTGGMDLKLTLSEELGGGTYAGSMKITGLQKNLLSYSAMKFDFSQLAALLMLITGTDVSETEEILALLDEGMEGIVDLDGGKMYLRGKMLDAVLAGDLAEETWYSMDIASQEALLGGMDLNKLAEMQSVTVGQLVWMLSSGGSSVVDPVYSYDNLLQMAEAFAAVKDKAFYRTGNGWRCELPLDSEYGGSGTLRVEITGDENAVTAMEGSVVYTDGDETGSGMKLDCSFVMEPLYTDIRGRLDTDSGVRAEFRLEASAEEAPDAVLPEIPADSVDLGGLLEDLSAGVIGGADGPTAMFVAAG